MNSDCQYLIMKESPRKRFYAGSGKWVRYANDARKYFADEARTVANMLYRKNRIIKVVGSMEST